MNQKRKSERVYRVALFALIAALSCSGCLRFGCSSDPDRYLLFDTITLVEDYYVSKVSPETLLVESFKGLAFETAVRTLEKEKAKSPEEPGQADAAEQENPAQAPAEGKPDATPAEGKPDATPAAGESAPGTKPEDSIFDEYGQVDPEKLMQKASFQVVPKEQGLALAIGDKTVEFAHPVDKEEMIDAYFQGYETLRTELGIEDADKEFFYAGIDGMVRSLDPHSSFLPPAICSQLREETSGSFAGVGIEIGPRSNQLTVIQPIEGTPAFEAGIKPMDVISAIDGKSTLGMSLMEAVELIRGVIGTKVILTIVRKGLAEPFDVELVRATIDENSVKANLLPGRIGYFRVYKFNEKTAQDLNRAMDRLVEESGGLKSVILDLRGNPGGLLDQAVEVADKFIESGLIVNTMGRGMFVDKRRYATSRNTERSLPVLVLINLQSASGAEIVAGALQDHERALLIGSRTYGKGSVQSIFKLPENACLKLTTALYYTPSGRSIQATGIIPDVSFLYPEEEEKLYAEFTEGALKNHLEDEKADQHTKSAYTFDVERLFAYYEKQGLVTVDPDFPEKADWLLVFARQILSGADLTSQGMLQRAGTLLDQVPEGAPAPAPEAKQAS